MAIAATQIVDARARAEQDWQDSQAVKSRDIMPSMKTLQAVLGQQTARFPSLKDRSNCGSMTLTWEAGCPTDATIITGVQKINSFLCAPTGTGSTTAKATYGIGKILQSPGFYITDDNCGNVYDNVELLARGLLVEHKAMAEKLDKYLLAQLVTFSGVNTYLGNGLVTSATGNIYKLSSFDAVASTLVPYLLRAGEANNMTNPFVLMGDAIYNNKYIDAKQAGTPADKAYFDMWNDLAIVEDFKAFNALGMNDDFFMMDQGATALVTKYTGTATPQTLKSDYYLTTMPLLGGTIRDNQGEPLYVDVYHQRGNITVETVGGQTRCVLADTFQLELKFDFLLNPVACNAGYTGITHFKKDATIDPMGVPATYAKVPQVTGKVYQAV